MGGIDLVYILNKKKTLGNETKDFEGRKREEGGGRRRKISITVATIK